MGVFLRIDGVDGESTDDRHKGEIELTAWSFGVTAGGTGRIGAGGGAGRPTFTDLAVTKRVDRATPVLMGLATSGRHAGTAVLTVTTSGEDPVDLLVVGLGDVEVSSCLLADAVGAEEPDGPVENVGLSFRTVTVTHHGPAADGAAGEATRFGWDVTRNATL